MLVFWFTHITLSWQFCLSCFKHWISSNCPWSNKAKELLEMAGAIISCSRFESWCLYGSQLNKPVTTLPEWWNGGSVHRTTQTFCNVNYCIDNVWMYGVFHTLKEVFLCKHQLFSSQVFQEVAKTIQGKGWQKAFRPATKDVIEAQRVQCHLAWIEVSCAMWANYKALLVNTAESTVAIYTCTRTCHPWNNINLVNEICLHNSHWWYFWSSASSNKSACLSLQCNEQPCSGSHTIEHVRWVTKSIWKQDRWYYFVNSREGAFTMYM